jgi:hypothetical protein
MEDNSVFGPEYPKINGAFKRDMANGGVIMPDIFSTDEFKYLEDSLWTWTEKVDGTNVRLHFNGEKVAAGGRTKDAQMPGHLMYALAQYNDPHRWVDAFGLDDDGTQDATIYGEGYGPKIQNGGRYRTDVGFIVFDIRIGRWWLKREDVVEVAGKMGMDVVPIVATCSLNEAIGQIRNHDWAGVETLTSIVAENNTQVSVAVMEGIVGTPSVPLYDRRGNRIITKLKIKDFENLEKRTERAKLAEAFPAKPGFDRSSKRGHTEMTLGQAVSTIIEEGI